MSCRSHVVADATARPLPRWVFVAFVTLAMSGCFAADLPSGAAVRCSQEDCPSGSICVEAIGRCVPVSSDDQDDPTIEVFEISPSLLAIDDEARFFVQISESLFRAPIVEIEVEPSRHVELQPISDDFDLDNDSPSFIYSYTATGEETQGDRPVRITLVDKSGNVASNIAAGTVTFDFEAPDLAGAPSFDGDLFFRAGDEVHIDVEFNNPLGDTPTAKITHSSDQTSHALVVETDDEESTVFSLTTDVTESLAAGDWTVEIAAQDRAGNASTILLDDALHFDFVGPDLLEDPALSTTDGPIEGPIGRLQEVRVYIKLDEPTTSLPSLIATADDGDVEMAFDIAAQDGDDAFTFRGITPANIDDDFSLQLQNLVDRAGNQTQKEDIASFHIDAIQPWIKSSTLDASRVAPNGTVSGDLIVSEVLAVAPTIELRDDNDTTLTADAIAEDDNALGFRFDISLDDSGLTGLVTLTTNLQDLAGNRPAFQLDPVFVDDQPPQVNNIVLAPKVARLGSVVQLEVSTQEPLAEPPSLTSDFDFQYVQGDEPLLHRWLYTIDGDDAAQAVQAAQSVGLIDVVGNSTVVDLSDDERVALIIDPDPPSFSILNDGDLFGPKAAEVYVELSSDDEDITEVSATIDGFDAPCVYASTTLTIDPAATHRCALESSALSSDHDGARIVEIRAEDHAGNTIFVTGHISFDVTGPQLDQLTISPTTAAAGRTLVISATFDEPVAEEKLAMSVLAPSGDIVHPNFDLSLSTDQRTATWSTVIAGDEWSSGDYSVIAIIAADSLGNNSIIALNAVDSDFAIDTVPPSIVIDGSTARVSAVDGFDEIEVLLTTDVDDTGTLSVRLDALEFDCSPHSGPSSHMCAIEVTGNVPSSGTQVIVAEAIDAAGNADSDSSLIVVDRMPPELLSIETIPPVAKPGDTVIMRITVNEALSAAPELTLSSSMPWTLTPIDTGDGVKYDWSFVVEDDPELHGVGQISLLNQVALADSVGNATVWSPTSSDAVLAIDLLPPLISVEPTQILMGATPEEIHLVVTADEFNDDTEIRAGVAGIPFECTLRNSEEHPGDIFPTTDCVLDAESVPVWQSGQSLIQVIAEDAAGNVTAESVIFIVDRDAPQIISHNYTSNPVGADATTSLQVLFDETVDHDSNPTLSFLRTTDGTFVGDLSFTGPVWSVDRRTLTWALSVGESTPEGSFALAEIANVVDDFGNSTSRELEGDVADELIIDKAPIEHFVTFNTDVFDDYDINAGFASPVYSIEPGHNVIDFTITTNPMPAPGDTFEITFVGTYMFSPTTFVPECGDWQDSTFYGGTLNCEIDLADIAADYDWWTFTESFVLSVNAEDAAGNLSPDAREVIIDRNPPWPMDINVSPPVATEDDVVSFEINVDEQVASQPVFYWRRVATGAGSEGMPYEDDSCEPSMEESADAGPAIDEGSDAGPSAGGSDPCDDVENEEQHPSEVAAFTITPEWESAHTQFEASVSVDDIAEDGTYELFAYEMEDRVGNRVLSTHVYNELGGSFVVDRQPPSIEVRISTISDGEPQLVYAHVEGSNEVVVDVEYDEEVADGGSIEVEMSGEALDCGPHPSQPNTQRCRLDVDEWELTSNSYSIVGTATDTAGNAAFDSVTFSVDTEGPALRMVSSGISASDGPSLERVGPYATWWGLFVSDEDLGESASAQIDCGDAFPPVLMQVEAGSVFLAEWFADWGGTNGYQRLLRSCDVIVSAVDEYGNDSESRFEGVVPIDFDPPEFDGSVEDLKIVQAPWGIVGSNEAEAEGTAFLSSTLNAEASPLFTVSPTTWTDVRELRIATSESLHPQTVVGASVETNCSMPADDGDESHGGTAVFVLPELPVDTDFVALTLVDCGGLTSDVYEINGHEWLATLGGKKAGSTTENPFIFKEATEFKAGREQGGSEPESPASLADTTNTVSTRSAIAWRGQSRSWPEARAGATLVYDTWRGEVVLFGGAGTEGYAEFDDTWIYDGSWRQQSLDVDPPAKVNAAAGFDAHRGVVVMLSGDTVFNAAQDETWEWNGEEWTLNPAVAPAARSKANLVYDPSRQQMVLFGGTELQSPYEALCDTSVFDGNGWTVVEDHTDVGCGDEYTSTMTWHPTLEQMIRYSASSDESIMAALVDNAWIEIPTQNAPTPRVDASLYFDDRLQRAVLAGGRRYIGQFEMEPVTDNFYTFHNSQFEQLDALARPIYDSTFVYDAARQTAVAFGGFEPGDNGFSQDPGNEAVYISVDGINTRDGPLDYPGTIINRAMTTWTDGVSMAVYSEADNAILVFDGERFSESIEVPPISESGEAEFSFAVDYSTGEVVVLGTPLFQGDDCDSGLFFRTLIYDGDQWRDDRGNTFSSPGWFDEACPPDEWSLTFEEMEAEQASRPSSRSRHGMVWDGQGVLLFRGYTNSLSALRDTWRWRDGTWEQLSDGTGDEDPPDSFYRPRMAYDEASEKVFMFGQTETPTYVWDPLYEWDGVAETWTRHIASYQNPGPEERFRHTFYIDETLGVPIVIGGVMDSHASEVWAWTGETWSLLVDEPTDTGDGPFAYGFGMWTPEGREVIVIGHTQGTEARLTLAGQRPVQTLRVDLDEADQSELPDTLIFQVEAGATGYDNDGEEVDGVELYVFDGSRWIEIGENDADGTTHTSLVGEVVATDVPKVVLNGGLIDIAIVAKGAHFIQPAELATTSITVTAAYAGEDDSAVP